MTYDENVITIYWSGHNNTYLSQGDPDDHFKLANHRGIAASYPTVIWVVPVKTGTWNFGSMPQWFVSAIESGDVLFVPDEEYPEYGRFMVGENVGPILFNNNGKLEVFTRDEYRMKYFL